MSKLILALDQSTQKSGWAIYNPDNNSLVDYGKIEPTGDIWSRIISLRDWVRFTILSQNITTLVIEEIQLQNIPGTSREGNVATFKKLAFVQAILIELAINLNIKYEIMPSSRWKSVCGIKGTKRTEQKKNAQLFVNERYGIKPTQDECDAICIGYAYCLNNDEGISWE